MALSEHEQRLLEEMERNLYRHDADFVSSVTGARGPVNYRFVAFGALIAIAGFALVVTALTTQFIALGVLGFVVVLGGVMLALRTTPASATATSARSSRSRAPRTRGSFMDRMNDRWDRRTS
ncbi:MAG: DUF3040 domain-containing protein [Agromyces sp.]